MARSADVVVVGLGGMGSAAAAHLARRGRRVLGFEQHTPAHDRGSSHGDSRVYRQAYFEHPRYVPLLQRAWDGWKALERATGAELLTVTGGLMIGPPASRTVAGSLASARRWGLPHELLDARTIRARFPVLTPGPEEIGLWEANAGFVRPEATVAAHLALARAAGADLRFGRTVTGWSVDGRGGVEVRTDDGTFTADRLVISAGAWASRVVTDLGVRLEVERQVQFWFRPPDGVDAFRLGRLPVYVWDSLDGAQIYGFPHWGPESDGVKVAFFRHGSPADPDRLRREVGAGEGEDLLAHLARRIPGLCGPVARAVPCMYTSTPDEHFVVGLHPSHPEVVVAAGFSGHGFKFVPVIGELLADLAVDGGTDSDIGLFAPDRFGGGPAPGPVRGAPTDTPGGLSRSR